MKNNNLDPSSSEGLSSSVGPLSSMPKRGGGRLQKLQGPGHQSSTPDRSSFANNNLFSISVSPLGVNREEEEGGAALNHSQVFDEEALRLRHQVAGYKLAPPVSPYRKPTAGELLKDNMASVTAGGSAGGGDGPLAVVEQGPKSEKPFNCGYCDRAFRYSCHLRRHEACQTCHKVPLRPKSTQAAPILTTATTSRDTSILTPMQQQSVPERLPEPVKKNQGCDGKPLEYPVCQQRFKTRDCMVDHGNTLKPLVCSVCGKGFSRLDDHLDCYVNQLNVSERPFKCQVTTEVASPCSKPKARCRPGNLQTAEAKTRASKRRAAEAKTLGSEMPQRKAAAAAKTLGSKMPQRKAAAAAKTLGSKMPQRKAAAAKTLGSKMPQRKAAKSLGSKMPQRRTAAAAKTLGSKMPQRKTAAAKTLGSKMPQRKTAAAAKTLGSKMPQRKAAAAKTLGSKMPQRKAAAAKTLGSKMPQRKAAAAKTLGSKMPQRKAAAAKTLGSKMPQRKAAAAKTLGSKMPQRKTAAAAKTLGSKMPQRKTAAAAKTLGSKMPQRKAAAAKTLGSKMPQRKAATAKTLGSKMPQRKAAAAKTLGSKMPQRKTAAAAKTLGSKMPQRKAAAKTLDSKMPQRKAAAAKTLDSKMPQRKAAAAAKTLDSKMPQRKAAAAAKTLDSKMPQRQTAAAKTLDSKMPQRKAAAAAKTLDSKMPQRQTAAAKTLDSKRAPKRQLQGPNGGPLAKHCRGRKGPVAEEGGPGTSRVRPRFESLESISPEQGIFERRLHIDETSLSSDLSIDLSRQDDLTSLTTQEGGDEEDEELPSFLIQMDKGLSEPPSITEGMCVWCKFRMYPFWPAVVKRVNRKQKKASILFMEDLLSNQSRNGLTVALKTLKPFNCEDADQLVSEAKLKYNAAISWCLELIADYRIRIGCGSFTGSFIQYFADDISYPVRRMYPRGTSEEHAFPCKLMMEDQLELQERERVTKFSPIKCLPDRTHAVRTRFNEKLVQHIVRRRMVETHLLAVISGQQQSRWLRSFLQASRRMVNVYLEDNGQLDQVYYYLQGLYNTAPATAPSLATVDHIRFVLEVLLPEAVIYAIAGVDALSIKKAEEKYLKGPPISKRERRDFDKLMTLPRRELM